jgi:hypothetical protein
MIVRLVLLAAALLTLMQPAHARRVALVVGQGAYLGGAEATIGLSPLVNPPNDAGKIAQLLDRHGFEVLSCDGKRPGCFDLDRAGLLAALDRLEVSAKGAEMALVFFAGHGLSTEEGNVLAPIDAKVDCATGAVRQGVTVERFMRATEPATHKLLILDACRDNPLGLVCPGLKNKKLSFTRIEAGAMQGLLLVTSTQFGQQALDGPPGSNSPFATALLGRAGGQRQRVFRTGDERGGPRHIRGGTQTGRLSADPGQSRGRRCAGRLPRGPRLHRRRPDGGARDQNRTALGRRSGGANRGATSGQPSCEAPGAGENPAATVVSGPNCRDQDGKRRRPHHDDRILRDVGGALPCSPQEHNARTEEKVIDTGNVLYIYRDFPDSDLGIQTHMIAHCIGSDDRSRFLEALYGRKLVGPTGLIHFTAAEQLGFSREKIDSCLADPKLRSDVVSLMDGMKRLNLYAFPTFFINSEMTVGQAPLEFFEAKFNEILASGK